MEEWKAGSIHALRLALRLSQEKFADRVGASAKSISNWERGLNSPSLDLRNSLDGALASASSEQRERFAFFLGTVEPAVKSGNQPTTPSESAEVQPSAVGRAREGEEAMDRRQALRAAGALAVTTMVPDPVDQSRRLLAAFAGSRIGAEGLDHVEASVDRLACEYFDKPFDQLAAEVSGLRQITSTLMRGTPSLAEQRHLGLMTGLLSGMLGALSLDSGDFPAADVHLEVAWRLGSEVRHDRLCCWVWALRSNAAFYRDDLVGAVELARAGRAVAAQPADALRLMSYEARALARMGDVGGTGEALRRAESLVAGATLDGPGRRVSDFDLARYTVAASTSLVWIGQFPTAREYSERALALFDGPYPSLATRLIARVDLALVELHEGDLEHALALGHDVLDNLRGRSVVMRLLDLDHALSPLRSSPAVSEFHERVAASR